MSGRRCRNVETVVKLRSHYRHGGECLADLVASRLWSGLTEHPCSYQTFVSHFGSLYNHSPRADLE